MSFTLALVLSAGLAHAQDQPKPKEQPKEPSKPSEKEEASRRAMEGLIGTSRAKAEGPKKAPEGKEKTPNSNQPFTPAVPIARPMALPGVPNNLTGQSGVQPGAGNQPNPSAAGAGQPGAGAGAGAPHEGGAGGGDVPEDISTDDPNYITLSAFSEPVDLTVLVELVAKTLNINITIKGELTGTVVFNAPVKIHKDRLKNLLDALLEQHAYALTYDPDSTFYSVVPSGEVNMLAGDERPTQRVFSTPNMRPTSLKTAIEGQLGIPPVAPGGGSNQRQIAYIDELGMIVVTDTPRRLAAIERMLNAFQEEFAKAQFIRIELMNVSAPVARERALQLIGEAPQRTSMNGGNDAQAMAAAMAANAGRATASLDNLGDRLTIDPQGNALIFRGLPQEIEQVRKLVEVIDVKNTLTPIQYFVGSAAQQVADLARQQGLGEVTTIAAQQQQNPYNFNYNQQFPQQARQQPAVGGPVMVVDEARGTIVYYGTLEQHDILKELIIALNIQSEKVVIKPYKLRYNKAEDVASVIMGLINNQTPRAGSHIIDAGTGQPMPAFNGGFQDASMFANLNRPNYTQPDDANASPDDLMLDHTAFVIADEKNNQVLVKAQLGQQDDFKKLIDKLDLRRPQVYVEAKIVAVTADDRLRLAFENQLINAGGKGGVLNTNFGLGSFASSAAQPLVSQKVVSGAITGFSAAIINSDQVPIVMRALANETDSRIVAAPQLLVDDNEEAEVTSVDSQPVPTRIVRDGGSANSDVVTSDREVEAGTTLKVTPQISDGGSLRLKYEIELSSFTGEGTNDLPPPRQRNTIKSDSITVPHDSTVVVGGLVVDSKTKSIAKVPLLGDIPLFGLLFQDRNTGNRQTVLYVFLTPRILRDENFQDAFLLTKGPQARSGLAEDIPVMMPTTVEIITQEDLEARFGPAEKVDAPATDDAKPAEGAPPAPTDNEAGKEGR